MPSITKSVLFSLTKTRSASEKRLVEVFVVDADSFHQSRTHRHHRLLSKFRPKMKKKQLVQNVKISDTCTQGWKSVQACIKTMCTWKTMILQVKLYYIYFATFDINFIYFENIKIDSLKLTDVWFMVNWISRSFTSRY